jgi:hypothetical protein
MLTIKTREALEAAPIPPSWKAALAERLDGAPLMDDDPDKDGCVVVVLQNADETKPFPECLGLQPPGVRLSDLLRATIPDAELPADALPDAFEWVDQINPGLFLAFLLRGNDYGYLVLVNTASESFDPETAALLREVSGNPPAAEG